MGDGIEVELDPNWGPGVWCSSIGRRQLEGRRAYQSSGIGAVETEESDRGLDPLAGGRRGGGERSGLAEDGPLRRRGPHGAEQCLSRQHGWCGIRCVDWPRCCEVELQFSETRFGRLGNLRLPKAARPSGQGAPLVPGGPASATLASPAKTSCVRPMLMP